MSSDTARLAYLMDVGCDSFAHVRKDRHEYATEVAAENGREEPNRGDELEGFRRLIDCAIGGGDKTVRLAESGARSKGTKGCQQPSWKEIIAEPRPDNGAPEPEEIEALRVLALEVQVLRGLLKQVERWMSGYGTTSQSEMRERVRAALRRGETA